jgi:ankyrin repeat protein
MDLTTQIYDSAKQGDAETVIGLIQMNPFVPKQNSVEIALLTAAEYGQLAVVRACIMDLRCNPNCVDKNGRSPLHMSVIRKQNGKIAISIIKFLVSQGSKIRKSVLHVCANDLAIFPLTELGADVNAKSVDGLTPLSVAVSSDRQEVVSELIRAKAIVDSDLIFKAQSSQVIKDLVRNKVDPNTRDQFGNTALFYAVESGNKSVARALLEVGADSKQFSLSRSNSVSSGSNVVTPMVKSPLNSSEDNCSDIVARLKSVYESLSSEKLWDSYLPDQLVEVEKFASQMISKTIEIRDAQSQKLSASLCVVCRSEQKSVLVMPCRHLCMCSECSQALTKGGTWDTGDKADSELIVPACPVCRATVVELVSVYT